LVLGSSTAQVALNIWLPKSQEKKAVNQVFKPISYDLSGHMHHFVN